MNATDQYETTQGAGSRPQGELLSLGPVGLRVSDAKRASRFWQELIGLRPLQSGGINVLGSGAQPLIELREAASRGAGSGYSGLYHVAVHFPSELEFGRVIARLIAAGQPISPVDHLFSKAIYLQDPDSITVELALETPWRVREMFVDDQLGLHAIDRDGQIRRPNEPLDISGLLGEASGSDLAAPADGAYIGHVHLSVADIHAALAFYRDQLGMLEHVSAPKLGFADLHAGGDFKHRVALNTWQSLGAPPTPTDMAGMDRFTIRLTAHEQLEQAAMRMEQAGANLEALDPDGLRVHDPAGYAIDLVV
jgi:catechol 2,3-dioxygenase